MRRSLIVPPPLEPGALIHVAQSAGPSDPGALQAGIERLERAGFRVRLSPVRSTPPYPALAAHDDERLADLIDALTHPEVRCVIEARGGWGCARIVDRIPRGLLAARPRWVVGYSDVTTLHAWCAAEGVVSLHAPMVAGLARHDADASLRSLIGVLTAAEPSAAFAGVERIVDGRFGGRAVGGNLSILASLMGTRWAPDLDGAVLFVEDVGEAPYRIDRMLTQLLASPAAQGLRGVVLGQFTRCGDNDAGATLARQRAVELLGGCDVAVLAGADFGHGAPNLPLPLGFEARFDEASNQVCLVPPASTPPTRRTLGRASSAQRLVHDAVENNVCSAIAVRAGVGDATVVAIDRGMTRGDRGPLSRPVDAGTRFDLASVTKAVCTAVLAWQAVERHEVSLDTRIGAHLCASRPTLGDLLRHTAGLPAHVEVFRSARTASDPRATARREFAAVTSTHPVGVHCYSDVGYVALGRWLEELADRPLAELFDEQIAQRLGLVQATFGDGEQTLVDPATVAATEFCPQRGAVLQALVHDENCQVLGGAAGHAGLFATADEVATIARSLLGHGPQLLAPATVARMWDTAQSSGPGTHTLGWDTPSGPASNAGSLTTPGATVGHLGFTGTSLWIDRDRGSWSVILTNRVHPSRANDRIRTLRPALSDALLRALDEGTHRVSR